jgi:hypothetical protein
MRHLPVRQATRSATDGELDRVERQAKLLALHEQSSVSAAAIMGKAEAAWPVRYIYT